MACRFLEDRECAVGAAVIHENDLVGAARHVGQDSPCSAQEFRKNRFFIVDRDGNGETESWIHGIARPSMGFRLPDSIRWRAYVQPEQAIIERE